jgi:dihydrofolate reductase
MATVVVDITISLDGFVTAPNPGPEQGLGEDGLILHDWALISDDPVDRAILREGVATTGAIVMGRNLFDIVDAPTGWNDQRAYGADERGAVLPPAFVVTHEPPAESRLGIYTFVPEGVERAIELAREVAGEQRVAVMGGGDVCRQALDGGWFDELSLHISPVIFGSGTPLFREGGVRVELEQIDVQVSKHATHARYRRRR